MSEQEFKAKLRQAGVREELVQAMVETKPPFINWDDLSEEAVKLMTDLALMAQVQLPNPSMRMH